jgi:hypothetical protein
MTQQQQPLPCLPLHEQLLLLKLDDQQERGCRSQHTRTLCDALVLMCHRAAISRSRAATQRRIRDCVRAGIRLRDRDGNWFCRDCQYIDCGSDVYGLSLGQWEDWTEYRQF